MSAITDHYDAITREIVLPGIRDNFFYEHPVLDSLWKNRKTLDGGRLVDWSFFIDGNQNAQTYKAFDQYLVKPIGFAKRASLPWCHMVMPLMLSKIEMAMNKSNSSQSKLVDYISESINHAKRGFRERLSQDLHGDGSTFSHPYWATKTENPIVGLKKILSTDREYAGFDSSTYTKLNPYVRTISASSDFGDLMTPGNEDYLPDILSEIINETDHGAGKINMISGSIIMAEALEKCAMHREVRVVSNGGTGTEGHMGLSKTYFRDVEIMSDRDSMAGEMNLLNTKTIKLVVLAGHGLDFGSFEEFSTRDDITASMLLSMQLVAEEPRTLGNITGGPDDRTIT